MANIPFGQVVLLTNPYLGILTKTTHMIEFILSMAKDYKVEHNISTRPVQYSGLWDCFVCKVKVDEDVQILVSDKDSLVEMLCEFWGLDYEEVRKSYKLPVRYKKMGMTCGGEDHPIRVSLPPRSPLPSSKEDDSRIILGCMQEAQTRDEAYGNFRSTIIDNFNNGYGITLDEIIAIYKEEEKKRKTYTLDIHKVPKEDYVKGKKVILIKDCVLKLIDNYGKEYPFDAPVKSKAIYLTFLLFPKGFWIKDIAGNQEFYDAFKKIYTQLPYFSKKYLPDNFDQLSDIDSTEYKCFLQQMGDTRDAIMDVTNDNSARKQFAIEGDYYTPFRVAGATDENREKVKKIFGLK